MYKILFWAKYHQDLWGDICISIFEQVFWTIHNLFFYKLYVYIYIKGRKRKKSSKPIDEDTDSNDGPADRFRRGEHVPSDYEIASQR